MGSTQARRRIRPAAAFVAAALLVTACVAGDEDGDPASGQDEDAVSEVVIGIESDITTTDCQATSGDVDDFVLGNMCESILLREVNGSELVPHVVTGWELSEDELVWTLHLRDDIDFQNGDHFTAEDLKASVERITDPQLASNQANFWDFIQDVVVVDDYTAQFVLAEPNPLMFVFAERLPLIPKSLYDEVGATEYTGTEPVGMGAYKLVEWRRDDQVIFEAFDDYFLGRPEIDRVIFRVIPDEAARVAALRAGEVDIIFPMSPQQVEQVESDPDLVVYSPTSLARVRLTMNTNVEPWNIREVRQAVNHAIDVDTIVEELAPDAVRIAGPLVPEEVGFNADLEPYEYDPDLARQILADAGFGDGIGPVEFSVNTGYGGTVAEEIAQALAADLEDVGILTELRLYDSGDFNTRKREKKENPGSLGPLQYDGHSGGDTFHAYHHMYNVIGCDQSPVHSGYYCNPDVDALVNEAAALWTSDNERAIELFEEAQQLVYDDAWAGFLFQLPDYYGVRADLNWEPDSSGKINMRLASRSDE